MDPGISNLQASRLSVNSMLLLANVFYPLSLYLLDKAYTIASGKRVLFINKFSAFTYTFEQSSASICLETTKQPTITAGDLPFDPQ